MGKISTTALLSKLRSLMKNLKYVPDEIHAYIIPSGDAHQSEYIASCDERRAFITGFTGSSGTAIVTANDALLWTDGRYFTQATQQLDDNWQLMKMDVPDAVTKKEWLIKNLPEGSKVGVDPVIVSYDDMIKLNDELECAGIDMIPVAHNLIDCIWLDKPERPNNSIVVHTMDFAGRSIGNKIDDVRDEMKKKSSSVLILTVLDEIAWLFNLRGSDIDYNPVFFSYAIITLDYAMLFVDSSKIDDKIQSHLSSIQLMPYDSLTSILHDLLKTPPKTWVSPASSYSIVQLIPKNCRILQPTPVSLLKAVKNDIEIEAMTHAHIRDAVALSEFFSWLEDEVCTGEIREVTAADKLEGFRREQDNFFSLSFETISSVGANAAIIHYKPTSGADSLITTDEIYLCDSGGQYYDGTTDVTRTVHFGSPTPHQKDCFTRVLKGHIALATAVFPKDTYGHQIDALARLALWKVGLNYLHGTGHGVGHFLCVHEGPQGISFRKRKDDVGLRPGMVVSDEPGYYEEGSFGIRIENCYVVVPVETKHNFNNTGYCTLEPLTYLPIQAKMLDPSMLTVDEIAWLDNYHKRCRDLVGNELKAQGRLTAYKWLQKQTEPLA